MFDMAKSAAINVIAEIWLQSYLAWYRRMEMRMHYNLPVESAAESNFRRSKEAKGGT